VLYIYIYIYISSQRVNDLTKNAKLSH
jgi:hypothetical protein